MFSSRPGPSVDHPDGFGVTPLMDACERGDLDLIRLLCESGANVNRQCQLGATPMDYAMAVRPGDEALRSMLLSLGARSTATPQQREDLAERRKQRQWQQQEKLYHAKLQGQQQQYSANSVAASAPPTRSDLLPDFCSPPAATSLTASGARTLAMLIATPSDDDDNGESDLHGMFSPVKRQSRRGAGIEEDGPDDNNTVVATDSATISAPQQPASDGVLLRQYFSTPVNSPKAGNASTTPSNQQLPLTARSQPSTPPRRTTQTAAILTPPPSGSRKQMQHQQKRLPLSNSMSRESHLDPSGSPLNTSVRYLPTSHSAASGLSLSRSITPPVSSSPSPSRVTSRVTVNFGMSNPWKMGATGLSRSNSTSNTATATQKNTSSPSPGTLSRSSSNLEHATLQQLPARPSSSLGLTHSNTSDTSYRHRGGSDASQPALSASFSRPPSRSQSGAPSTLMVQDDFLNLHHATPSRMRQQQEANPDRGRNGRGSSFPNGTNGSGSQSGGGGQELADFSGKHIPPSIDPSGAAPNSYVTPMSPISPLSLELLLKQHSESQSTLSNSTSFSGSDVSSPVSPASVTTSLSNLPSAISGLSTGGSSVAGLGGGLNRAHHARILSKAHGGSSSNLLSVSGQAVLAAQVQGQTQVASPHNSATGIKASVPPTSPSVFPPPALGTNDDPPHQSSSRFERAGSVSSRDGSSDRVLPPSVLPTASPSPGLGDHYTDMIQLSSLLSSILFASSERGADVSVRNTLLLCLDYVAATEDGKRMVLETILDQLDRGMDGMVGEVVNDSSTAIPSPVQSSVPLPAHLLQPIPRVSSGSTLSLSSSNVPSPAISPAPLGTMSASPASSMWLAEKLRAFSVIKYWIRTYPMDFVTAVPVSAAHPSDFIRFTLEHNSLSTLLLTRLGSYPLPSWGPITPIIHGLLKLVPSMQKQVSLLTGIDEMKDWNDRREMTQTLFLLPSTHASTVPSDLDQSRIDRIAVWGSCPSLIDLPMESLAKLIHSWTIRRMQSLTSARELLKPARLATSQSMNDGSSGSLSIVNQMVLSNRVSLWSGTEFLCAGLSSTELIAATGTSGGGTFRTDLSHSISRLRTFRKLVGCSLLLIRSHGNFNAAFELLVGLQMQSTFRIVTKEVEPTLTEPERRTWRRLNELMHSGENYKNYRSLLTASSTFTLTTDLLSLTWPDVPIMNGSIDLPEVRVPYLGVLYKDVVAIEEGGTPIVQVTVPTSITSNSTDPPGIGTDHSPSSLLFSTRLHFGKCRTLTNLLTDALHCQALDSDMQASDTNTSLPSTSVMKESHLFQFSRAIGVAFDENDLRLLSLRILPRVQRAASMITSTNALLPLRTLSENRAIRGATMTTPMPVPPSNSNRSNGSSGVMGRTASHHQATAIPTSTEHSNSSSSSSSSTPSITAKSLDHMPVNVDVHVPPSTSNSDSDQSEPNFVSV